MGKREEILQRIIEIDCELSDLYFENKRASMDMDGRKRHNLSEEWVFLSNKLDRENANP